ncbi:restriction endonuclease subunit S [Massilia sp. IC2-476]|uniref:restriction endonuclease subunit S n=1 Tax=Massilia sp. IC2-476 TaxID=2887199 RepID=UPI001D12C33C|nr:restriction endonuclease subunit S [Massilia sp. IC2-476]MCC2972958.1 restriction endonuclease subunit S [Massilia sp. IC2-476]
MNNIVPLCQVASVRTIMAFRDQSPVSNQAGTALAIGIRDIVGPWPLDFERLTRVDVAPELIDSALKYGEILLPARGDNYPARYFSFQEAPVFTVGQINVITPNSRIVGGYLAWYMNLPEFQSIIARSLTGTSIKSLSKSRLIEMPIKLPPLSSQHAIAEIIYLDAERLSLREKLEAIERIKIETTCRKIMQGEG